MAVFLIPLDPQFSRIPLEKTILLVGRQADCDVAITASRKVSRHHCIVAQVNSRIIVRDLGSTNGSFVNGSRVRQEARLRLGDELTIGDVRYRLEQRTREEDSQNEVDDEPLSSEMPVLLADGDSDSDVDASPLKTRRSSVDHDGPMVDFHLAQRVRSERALADSASF